MKIGTGELHEIDAHQADIDHPAGDARHGDSITNTDTVAANEKEIGHDCENHILQSHGNTRRDEPDVGCDGADLRHQPEYHDQREGYADNDPAQNEKLAPTAQIVQIAE